MSNTALTFDPYDQAIINALRKHPEGIRNTELNRESMINGKSLNVKTYNKHLKWLVDEGVVERFEEGRAKVTYKLHSEEFEEIAEIARARIVEIMQHFDAALSDIYDERQMLPEAEAKQASYEILFCTLPLLEATIISGLLHGDDNIAFSLRVNLAMEHIRELMTTANSVIEEDEDKSAYFHRLLSQIWMTEITKHIEKPIDKIAAFRIT